MTVQAELQFVTDAAQVASEAAAAVTRFRGALESLTSLSGMRIDLGSDISGQISEAAEGAVKIAEIQAKGVANLAAIEAQVEGRIASIEAQSQAKIAEIQARSAAALAQADAARASAESAAQAQIAQTEARAKAGIQTEQARATADVQRIAAQAQAEAQAHQQRVAEQYQKDRNAILVDSARASHAQQAEEAAHRHRMAELEKKAAADAQKVRIKGEEDRARIAAKAEADAARDARRVQRRGPALGSRLGGAAQSLAQGGGIQGAAGALGGQAGAVVAIGSAAVGVAGKVASLSYEFGRAVVEAQAYKEDIAEAFTVVRRTAAAGEATMLRAAATADRLGAARAETAGQFLDLATKGFDDAQIERIVGSLRDLTTIDPRASMEGLTKVIGKAQATGRINVDILSELSTFGLEQADVIKEIGKILGKTDQEVLKALSSAGGVRGLGVEPILNAINAQVGGGPAGAKAAAKADRNLSSLIKRVEDLPSNILFDISAGPGLDSIKAGLKEVLAYFDVGSESGKRVRKVVGDLFNALAEGLFGVRPGDKEGVTGTLDRIVEIAEKGVPVVREAAETVGTLARAMLALGSGDTSKLDSSTKRVVGILNLVKELVLLLAPGGNFGPGGLIQPLLDILGIDADATEVRKWVDAVAGLLNPANIFRTIKASFTGGDPTLGNPILTGIRDMITGAGEELTASASSLGTDIIDGMVSGITGGVQRVVDAAMSLGSSAISGVRSALDSHSPSREMIDVGGDAGEGLAIGYERSTSRVVGAAYDMADAGLRAATAQPFPLAMPAGLSSVPAANTGAAPLGQTALPPIVINNNFVFNAPVSDPAAVASAVEAQQRQLVREEVAAYFRRVAGG